MGMRNSKRDLGERVMKRYLVNLTNEETAEKVERGLERFRIERDVGVVIDGWGLVGETVKSAVYVPEGSRRRLSFLAESNLDGTVNTWRQGSSYRVLNHSVLRSSRGFSKEYNNFVRDIRAKIINGIEAVRFDSIMIRGDGAIHDEIKNKIKASCYFNGDVEAERISLPFVSSGDHVFDIKKAAYIAGACMGVELFEKDLCIPGKFFRLEYSIALVREKASGSEE